MPDVTATDLMQRSMRGLTTTMSLEEADRFLVESKVSGAPVYADGRVVGVLSKTDIARQVAVARSQAEQAIEYYRDMGSTGSLPSPGADDDEKDQIAGNLGDRLITGLVQDAMTKPALSVSATASIREISRFMVDHDIHRVLVTEGEKVVGVVSSMDLVRHLATADPTR